MTKMVCNTLLPLTNTCATSIVYYLWKRRDIYEDCNNENHWLLLENKVRADVYEFPLPESLISLLLAFVKPVGRHFFRLLYKWLRKTHIATSERWLTGDMLFECLTLCPIGMINHRKTAEKLLRSGRLNNVAAFRLACINNLEVEIGRLWPHVMLYILNKIAIEYQKFHKSRGRYCSLPRGGVCAPFASYVQEPAEVLFWISYCISKERGTNINTVPVFAGNYCNLYRYMAEQAIDEGDVTFYECIKNSSSVHFDYNHADVLKYRVMPDYIQFFFYHYSWLNTEEKQAFCEDLPRLIITFFLQWPLSSVFLEDVRGFWESVVGEELQEWLIVKILEILHGKKYLMHPFSYNNAQSLTQPERILFSDIYCLDQLKNIWLSLWKICPRSLKERIMTCFVFTHSYRSCVEKASFPANFSLSTLDEQLRVLFVTNGEAVLEFLEIENLDASLEYIISKYFPEMNLDLRLVQLPTVTNDLQYYFMTGEEMDRTKFNMTYFNSPSRNFVLRMVDGLHKPSGAKSLVSCDATRAVMRAHLLNFSNRNISVSENFLSYILQFLLLSNNINTSLFYE